MTDVTEDAQISLSQQLSTALRTAREKQHLSLSLVAESLKISEKQLANFESEAFDLTGLDPFQRGYLRNYASLIKVDLEAYQPQLNGKKNLGSDLQRIGNEPAPLVRLSFFRVFKWLLWLAGLVLLGMLVASGFN